MENGMGPVDAPPPSSAPMDERDHREREREADMSDTRSRDGGHSYREKGVIKVLSSPFTILRLPVTLLG